MTRSLLFEDAARRIIEEFRTDDGCFELRAPKSTDVNGYIVKADPRWPNTTVGGFFTETDRAIMELRRVNNTSIYITSNPVDRSLTSRENFNELRRIGKDGAAQAKDILRRDWQLIDVDALRAGGISATDPERNNAIKLRDQILSDHPKLAAASIWGSSGNGGWIAVYLGGLSNDEQSNTLCRNFLNFLDRDYTGALGSIETSVFDPHRIMPVPGTRKCKGIDSEERPWRYCTFDGESTDRNARIMFDMVGFLEENGVVGGVATGSVRLWTGDVPGTRNHADDFCHDDVVHRAALYVERMPAAIQGQHGSNATMAVATAIVIDFGLNYEGGFAILEGYNTRCRPAWSRGELLKKFDDAVKKSRGVVRGLKLIEGRDARRGIGPQPKPVAFASGQAIPFDAGDLDGPPALPGHGQAALPGHGQLALPTPPAGPAASQAPPPVDLEAMRAKVARWVEGKQCEPVLRDGGFFADMARLGRDNVAEFAILVELLRKVPGVRMGTIRDLIKHQDKLSGAVPGPRAAGRAPADRAAARRAEESVGTTSGRPEQADDRVLQRLARAEDDGDDRGDDGPQ